jgi:gliding motility-associated-like protein
LDLVEKQFLVLNLINAITPNGDGKNDVLDYSDLRIKKDVKMLVFDRHGNHIFSSQNKNSFIWNGMSSANRPIPTDTYWYVLEWIEPDTNVKMTFKGWILVKNRN